MSVLYLVLELVLAIVLVLGAHALRRRFGLGLFFSALAFVATVAYWVTATNLTTEVGVVSFRVSSSAFFSALLVGIFATYVLDGPKAGRAGMAVIAAVAILFPAITSILTLHMSVQGQTSPLMFIPEIRIMLSSIGAIVLDLVFLAISWEFANRLLARFPIFPRVFLVLLGVMWLDVVVFCVAAFYENPNLLLILKGGITSRFFVALAVSPLLASYLKFQQGRHGLEFKSRPLLAIFSQLDPEQLVREAQQETSKKTLELQESEARFKTYVDSAPDGIYIADAQGRYVDVNEAACRQTGFSRDELLCMQISELVAPEHLDTTMREFDQLVQTGRVSAEMALRHKAGHLIHVSLDAVRLSDDRFVAYCKDVTRRVKIEQDLRESETRLRAIIENEPECVKLIAPDGTVLEMNPAGLEMLCARSPAEVVGKSIYDVITEGDKGSFRDFNERVCAGEKDSLSFQMLDLQGNLHYMETTAVPFFYQPEDTTVMLGITRDVTKRQVALEELQRSNRLFQALSETTLLVALMDREFNFIQVNNSYAASDGHEPGYFIGKNHFDLYPGQGNQQLFSQVVKSGEPHTEINKAFEYPDQPERGATYWDWTLCPVKDPIGQVESVVLSLVNVTGRKLAEDERLSLERQVQHAQKLESLGVLAGGIAHDFNNILMAILGNADLALDEISPHAPARENLVAIEIAARRAAALAKQMLAYSGKGKFVIETINLNEFVEEMVHMLEVSISKKAVIKYYFADGLPAFYADATQVRQVIMNLITNASEATEDHSGVITISTGVMDCTREYLAGADAALRAGLDEPLTAGTYVYLEVADTGCGMDQETQEKIFDPFYTTKFTGRGLGMAAVLGIVRGHNGAIQVYSELGQGTTIKVLFPVDVKGEATQAIHVTPKATTAWQGSGTVLLADDEESIRAVGKLILRKLGFEVITAEDGREALELFRKHQGEIVCVVLDLTMPHLGGEDTFRELKAIRDDVKVILCSGYNEQEATQHFIGKGLAGFIQKPFAKPELLEQLKEILPG